jgi:hypothetical protein
MQDYFFDSIDSQELDYRNYTLNGLKLNFLDRITGLAGLDLYPVYPVILSK